MHMAITACEKRVSGSSPIQVKIVGEALVDEPDGSASMGGSGHAGYL